MSDRMTLLPFHLMAKPAGPRCNLACEYCFYLEKERLFPEGNALRMSDEVLETLIRQYCQSQDTPELTLAWQGGEPTLMGLEFFRRAVELEEKHAGGRRVLNSFQTNATLITDEWASFFAENGFLVGVSIDGPAELHDAFRKDRGGRASFDAVMRGVEMLKKHGVDFNTLTVINSLNAEHPLKVYRFLKDIGSTYHQYIPIVELGGNERAHELGLQLGAPSSVFRGGEVATVTPWSVRPEQLERFFVGIFDEWVRNDVARVYVQLFEHALSTWVGMGTSVCVFSETCGTALVVEHDGTVYSCDHYVYPDYQLGNVLTHDLRDMAESEFQRRFGQDKRELLPACCRSCDVAFICNGDCPKHRFVGSSNGNRVSYLCEAYKRLFRHMAGHLEIMGELLRRRASPAVIMDMLRREDEEVLEPAPDAPCSCGSGRKLKNCHGRRSRVT